MLRQFATCATKIVSSLCRRFYKMLTRSCNIYLLLIFVTSQRTLRKTLGRFKSIGLSTLSNLDTLDYSHVKDFESTTEHLEKLIRFSNNLVITLSILITKPYQDISKLIPYVYQEVLVLLHTHVRRFSKIAKIPRYILYVLLSYSEKLFEQTEIQMVF